MKKMINLLFCLCLGIGLVSAQSRQVTGTVISVEDGEPVIGASVTVKGTTLGTITDLDGSFTLSVPENAKTLTFSYVGMVSQEAPVGANLHIRLLSDTQRLEEVVVTAMGISREKKALGYSVQDVKGDALTQAASTSLSGAIQGKVSGIEVAPSSGMPGASAKITIRGSRSFTGNNSPLYVVDGMPIASNSDVSTGSSVSGTDFSNRAVDLDPNDIESINILKGQAASALYGMRASNGVVVITTKSGKGAKAGKPEVTFNSNLSFDRLSVLPEFQMEYAQGSSGKYNPTASTSWGPKITDLPNDPTYGGNTANAYTAGGKKEGKYYVPQRAAAGLDPWAKPQAYKNAEAFFNTGLTWSNAVNVIQGFDKGNYSFTLGNMNSEGIVPSTGMDRYNAKLSAEAKLHPHWTTGFSGNFVTSTISKQSSANNGVTATVLAAPPTYNLAGIPSHVEGNPYSQNTYRGTSSFDAAYWAVEHNKFIERSQRFFGNAYLNYTSKLNSDNQTLNLKYQLGNDAYTTNYSDVWGYGHANGRGEIYEYNYTINELNSLFTATYNWVINEDLVFDALYGNEFVDYKRQYHEAQGMNFNFPGWNHIKNATVYKGFGEYRRKRTAGNFGSLSLAYRNQLYFNLTGRHDIVSSMPRNNRSFFYPSANVGWIFTELEGLKNNILTYGKLRLSYAEVGQAGDYYPSYYTTPGYGGGFSKGTPILYPIGSIVAYTPYSRVYDPNLKPQNTRSYEIGADLSFLNGLVSLNYTYSRQNVKDQIFDVPLAGSTGSQYLVTNGGSVHTDAHEVSLGLSPLKTRHIQWDMSFNFTKIDNYVDQLAPGVESIFLGGFIEPQVRAGIGYKYPVIYGVSYLRNEAGQIVVDQNGLPQAGPEQVIGTVSPDFRLGFNTTLEIYKFRLSALIDWKQGGQMYAATLGLLDYYGVTQQTAEARKGKFLFEQGSVKVAGTDANGNPTYAPNDIWIDNNVMIDGTPGAQKYYDRINGISESMIYDNSFVKLREIALSYPVWDKNSLRVSLNVFARNILLWSKLKGIDPEASQGNNNMSGAFERFSLPGSSSYGLGLNVKF
ncbi:MAG: SusC/RagA family TonB-linked outer membrane protein [Tannerellaceae bacterium]|jgi:TonB-linked SusC/RagA family outer membrane protein|nr:SusC/RagA family TonB-linked outer membrane protein [Tannerellaceae bacterium]